MCNVIRHILIPLAFLLTGCASSIPKNISTTPEPNLTYDNFQSGYAEQIETLVRWGGEIISVENESTYSLVEILSNELGRSGRPVEKDEYQGRFIARVSEFLDPEYYEKGRKLTVFGTLSREMEKDISAHTYTYPVVEVEQFYLWPKQARFERVYVSPFYFYPYHIHTPFRFPYYGHPWRYRY